MLTKKISDSPTIHLIAGVRRDARGKVFRVASMTRLLRRLRRRLSDAHFFAELRGLLKEVRNSYWRIKVRWQSGVSHQGLQMGYDLHREVSEGVPQECKREHANTQDILELFSLRPYSTLVDADLFRAGWELGAEWMFRNYHTLCCVYNKPSVRLLGCNRAFHEAGEGSHSKLPPEVHQHSDCATRSFPENRLNP